MRSITTFGAVAALAVLAACSSDSTTAPTATRPSLAAGMGCSNVSGSVVAYMVNDTDVEGTISGSVSGQAFATVKSSTWKRNFTAAEVTLEHRYVTPMGEIFTSDIGTLRPIARPIDGYYNWFDFDNRLTIVGGTGAYAGATGTLRASGLFNPTIRPTVGYEPGGIQLRYAGKVCVPSTSAAAVER